MNRSFFSRPRARMRSQLYPFAVYAAMATLAGCAVYDSSLLSNMDSPLANGGAGAAAGLDDNGGAPTAAGAPSTHGAGEAGDPAVSEDAGASGDTSGWGGASGGNASAGSSATAGNGNGGSAQAGSAQGGSAQGGNAQAGSIAVAGAGGATAPHDLTAGKTATASTQQTGNEVEKGNDGNSSTRWCGKDDSLPQWWRVDLGASHELSSFSVAFQIATRAYTYDIETSPDDKVYTRRLTVTGTGAVQTGDFPAGVSARYVRLTVTHTEDLAAGVTVWASFYEFSVLGT